MGPGASRLPGRLCSLLPWKQVAAELLRRASPALALDASPRAVALMWNWEPAVPFVTLCRWIFYLPDQSSWALGCTLGCLKDELWTVVWGSIQSHSVILEPLSPASPTSSRHQLAPYFKACFYIMIYKCQRAGTTPSSSPLWPRAQQST